VTAIAPVGRSHQLTFLAGTLLFSLGRGIYASSVVIFLTRWHGLPAGTIGAMLSAAGIVGFLVSVPFGHAVDRFGARRVAALVHLGHAAVVAGIALGGSLPFLFAMTALVGAADKGNLVARLALVSQMAREGDRVRMQARVRTTFNVGVSVGALAAAPVIASTSRWPYAGLLLAVSVCFVLAAVSVLQQPVGEPLARSGAEGERPRPARPPWSFVALGLVSGVLALHVSILEVAIPLWIVHDTTAPASMVAILIFINTVFAVLFQVVASRHAETVTGAARTLALSAGVTAASCLLFAATGRVSGPVLIGGLVLAAVVLTFGELTQSAGAWGVSFGLSPEHAKGRHLGAFSVGAAIQDAFGPALIALLVIGQAPLGWWVVAGALAAAGSTVLPLTRAAERAGSAAGARV
jgi:MFS family permease